MGMYYAGRHRAPKQSRSGFIRTSFRDGSVRLGAGYGAIVFANLMEPSYGSAALTAAGVPGWMPTALAAVANLSVAAAVLWLARSGRQLSRSAVAHAFAIAALALAIPLLANARGPLFALVSAVCLMAYGIFGAAGVFGQITTHVDQLPPERRSGGWSSALAWHLPFGVVIGGLPALAWWGSGQIALVLLFGGLAVWAAWQWDAPTPDHGGRTSWRQLVRTTGAGGIAVAAVKAAWSALYLLPGAIHESAAVLAVDATAAQLVAFIVAPRVAALLEPRKKSGGLEPDRLNRRRARGAVLAGTALLVMLLAVVLVPTFLGTSPPAIAIQVVAFTLGEILGNVALSALSGMISTGVGGRRAQLGGIAVQFAAVAAVGAFVPPLLLVTGQLPAQLAAVTLALSVAGALALALLLPLRVIRARQRAAANAE